MHMDWPRIRIIEPVGVFNATYEFVSGLTDDQVTKMGAWLSYNCEHNFIFLKTSNQILAGGCTNAAAEWEQRCSDVNVADDHYKPYEEYQIRLMAPDIPMFEITWRDQIINPNP